MNIKTIAIAIETVTQPVDLQCQHCGEQLTPVQQSNGIGYYYLVDDRAISPQHLADWLHKIGETIARDPHPLWLHAKINQAEAEKGE